MPTFRRILRDNGLTLFLTVMFVVTFALGQVLSGWAAHNNERELDGLPPLTIGAYLLSPHFISSSAENWESEYLQLYVYVIATKFLIQRGSAESNDPDKPKPERPVTKDSPWPVRRGGWWRFLYARSLSLAFAALFTASFVLHAWASVRLENEERARNGRPAVSLLEHFAGPRFWFESFQNWQSEFLAIGTVVVFTIFLREKGSPESKAVAAPHRETAA